jgi:type VI secretion system protein VasD
MQPTNYKKRLGGITNWTRLALLAVSAAMLGACASGAPKPSKARMTIAAQQDVNPDANGRPSPVVVRIYQLAQDSKFNNADFFALFDNDQQALGADLLARDEATLAPGERKEVEFDVAGNAKFVGVIAAFRDIRNSQWRTIQPAPKKGLINLVKKDAVLVDVGRDKVVLTIND